MKRKNIYLIIIAIINILILINALTIYNNNKQRGYYIGKIESMTLENGMTTVEVSPIPSNRYFISEIKTNHQISYGTINISGLSDPRKESKRLKLGEMGEMIESLKVGDAIIFKVQDKYNKDQYNLTIE